VMASPGKTLALFSESLTVGAADIFIAPK